MAVFTPRGGLDGTSEVGSNQLHSVADAEDRGVYFLVEIGLHPRRILVHNARRAAGQNHAFWLLSHDLVRREVKGIDLAINTLFADTPGDKLRVLRAKIEDYYGFVMQEIRSL